MLILFDLCKYGGKLYGPSKQCGPSNSVVLDQIASIGAVWSVFSLFIKKLMKHFSRWQSTWFLLWLALIGLKWIKKKQLFVALLCFFFCLVFAMPLCVSVYMCPVVTCWERADLLALFVVSNCEFVTFSLVSWVRGGTWLNCCLFFAHLLTLKHFKQNAMFINNVSNEHHLKVINISDPKIQTHRPNQTA